MFRKTQTKMTGNNSKLDLVHVDVHTRFGQIMSICSQDIKWNTAAWSLMHATQGAANLHPGENKKKKKTQKKNCT